MFAIIKTLLIFLSIALLTTSVMSQQSFGPAGYVKSPGDDLVAAGKLMYSSFGMVAAGTGLLLVNTSLTDNPYKGLYVASGGFYFAGFIIGVSSPALLIRAGNRFNYLKIGKSTQLRWDIGAGSARARLKF